MNGTYKLTVRSDFAAAHRLRGYEGDCENLHGHNWKVEATVESETLDACGMAVDFRTIKAALLTLLDRYDHRFLNEVPPFDTINPSSENLARILFEGMADAIPAPARMARVAVWESDDAVAEYIKN